MGFFSNPTSYRLNAIAGNFVEPSILGRTFQSFSLGIARRNDHDSHPAIGHLMLLVFEAVMEVVCVSLPGYIVARRGILDADKQKFLAELNVMLFTPALIFTKLAAQLTADKLAELAVIPVIFIVQTSVSYAVSIAVARGFGFGKRASNFVTAMGVFGNSNSLPISLVISLSQTLKGLHWDKIPGDNDDEVAARGILYLLIFQQLGQMLRWSWGYHVLLAPAEKYIDHEDDEAIEEGRYRDEPEIIPGLDGNEENDQYLSQNGLASSTQSFESGGRTPVTNAQYAGSSVSDDEQYEPGKAPALLSTPANGNVYPSDTNSNAHIISFPSIRTPLPGDERDIPPGISGIIPRAKIYTKRGLAWVGHKIARLFQRAYHALPISLQRFLTQGYTLLARFAKGTWAFMNPPLWAMLFAVIVASVPKLQHLFFADGSFLANSATRAVIQTGGVAVPLILVVLGANLARNTLPKSATDKASEENQIGTKLLIASLISRMLLPTLIMAPMLALAAKYVPVSILDDPIFVIVCFLLTGAPSALQLAQICQLNGVYEGVMSKLLFQSYVIWILPSTLILVMCALEVVEWANL
ncbi:putative transporter [Hyphodiscus hymeniophilus]|uniref:Transporter n=1 Tax=Hyphodiscus hymeniophilus TaxID=353542 RepID=A0A9P6VPC3_9HELO|nr:putative transporter [Hyphodiscus hymeniophilus]